MRFREVFRRPLDLSVVWALLPFGLVAAGFALLPLRSWDYWWHVAFGRVVSQTGEMPLYAHFLYIMPADAPSYVQAWLSQWALFELHELVGLHGVLIVRNLVVGSAYFLLGIWAARRSESMMVGALCSLAGAVFGFFCVVARPHLLVWPFFLLLLAIGYGIRGRRLSLGLVSAFPVITILWVNLHGSFLMPTLICLAFAAAAFGDRWLSPQSFSARRVSAWTAGVLASVVATIANPRGLEVFGYLAELSRNPEIQTTVTEWFPTTPFFPPFFGGFFWLTFVVTAGLMVWQRERLDLADLFLFLGFSALAFRFSRGLLWYGLLLPVVAANYLRPLGLHLRSGEKPGAAAEVVNVVIAAVLLVLPFALQPWNGSNELAARMQVAETRTEPPLKGLVLAETPVNAANVLRLWDREPRIFHDHRYAGFLLYVIQKEVTAQMLYVDHRIELPSADQWRTYEEVSNGRGWREIFDRYDVNAVVASRENQAKLIDAMGEAAEWDLAFENEHCAFFRRLSP